MRRFIPTRPAVRTQQRAKAHCLTTRSGNSIRSGLRNLVATWPACIAIACEGGWPVDLGVACGSRQGPPSKAVATPPRKWNLLVAASLCRGAPLAAPHGGRAPWLQQLRFYLTAPALTLVLTSRPIGTIRGGRLKSQTVVNNH